MKYTVLSDIVSFNQDEVLHNVVIDEDYEDEERESRKFRGLVYVPKKKKMVNKFKEIYASNLKEFRYFN